MKCLKCRQGDLQAIRKDGKVYAQCDKCGSLFSADELKSLSPQLQSKVSQTPQIVTEASVNETYVTENNLSGQKAKITRGNKPYVVLQVVLKERLIGTGSGNLTQLENVINRQAAKGYRLHTISTTSSGSKGMLGGDRIQATMIFEKI